MGENNKKIEEWLKARANILARTNAMNGRYQAGNFGLDIWNDDEITDTVENITKRADMADQLITEAQAQGQNVDDPVVLTQLAAKVNSVMGRPKAEGLFHSLSSRIKKFVKYVTNPD